jgi:acyl carrier protein
LVARNEQEAAMTTTETTAVDQVVALVRETLALAVTEAIDPAQLLFYELAFTSMDLLDLLFRVEDHFGIAIPEGTLYALARGDLDDAAFASDGMLTAAGRDRLIALLWDTPTSVFPEQIHASTLPRYCTVGAIARLVQYKLAEKIAACSSSSSR